MKEAQHVTLIDNWNNMHMHRDKGVWINEVAENKGKKMKAAMAMYIQQESASSSNPSEQISVSDVHQLGIMTKELGIGSGKRIRGLGSNLLVETSSRSTSRYSKTSMIEDERYNKLSETVEKLCDIVKQLQAGLTTDLGRSVNATVSTMVRDLGSDLILLILMILQLIITVTTYKVVVMVCIMVLKTLVMVIRLWYEWMHMLLLLVATAPKT
ncbi:uncharacterized protein Pyn_28026 [Prunus yedoensis var. nudiflora]|uniref:Uncharacterized protein n=1 Tax=Prunus yedoensis var. nudiflora TaxID=2094558 RepID=A0A314Z896_PRUYE|nr:uncharacterized protein Pyn_28026 [Prunus yedoensis var. nudiflora]